MNLSENLTHQRELWKEAQKRLTKEDIRFIACKKGWQNKRIHMFSSRYYKREKMIAASEVFYGYVFKQAKEGESLTAPYPVWVLHSPEVFFEENPNEYAAILQRLQAKTAQKGHKRSKIDVIMREKYPEGFVVELPLDVTKGHLVLLSVIYCYPDVMPELKLGINLFLMCLGVSKEILFLPPRYWSKEYGEQYRKETCNG